MRNLTNKKMVTTSAILLGGLAFTQVSDASLVEGKWETRCYESRLLDASVKNVKKFKEDGSFEDTYKIYSDVRCENIEGYVKSSGDFLVKGPLINLEYNEITAKANNEIAASIFEINSLCSKRDWQVGRKVIISDTDTSECFFDDSVEFLHGTYDVDTNEDHLYFSPLVEDEELRIGEIDYSVVFLGEDINE